MATPKKGSKGKKAGGLGAGKTAAQKKATTSSPFGCLKAEQSAMHFTRRLG